MQKSKSRPLAGVFYKTERPAVCCLHHRRCVRLRLARVVFRDCIFITAICWALSVKIPHPHHSATLRFEARKAEGYSEQARLLCCEQIDTVEQLHDFLMKTQGKIPVLVKERERLYKQISRCEDDSQLPGLIQHRDALTEAIGKLRKDLKNAKAVMERCEIIVQKIQNITEQEAMQFKFEEKINYIFLKSQIVKIIFLVCR